MRSLEKAVAVSWVFGGDREVTISEHCFKDKPSLRLV